MKAMALAFFGVAASNILDRLMVMTICPDAWSQCDVWWDAHEGWPWKPAVTTSFYVSMTLSPHNISVFKMYKCVPFMNDITSKTGFWLIRTQTSHYKLDWRGLYTITKRDHTALLTLSLLHILTECPKF